MEHKPPALGAKSLGHSTYVLQIRVCMLQLKIPRAATKTQNSQINLKKIFLILALTKDLIFFFFKLWTLHLCILTHAHVLLEY